MKQSIYNSYLSYNNQYFMFNSLTRSFLFIDNKIMSLFSKYKQTGNFDNIKFKHNEFYESLIKGGFLIEKSKDEYGKAEKKWKELQNSRHKYELHINPTMNCNFNCWYCVQTHEKSKMGKDVKSNIISLIENIFDETPDLKFFDVNWFGGEPLLFYKSTVSKLLDEIYQTVKRRNSKTVFRTCITTNGFLINDQIISQFKKYNVQHFQITLDGHRERHNKVRYSSKNIGSYDEIISNIKKLAKNGINVIARINYSKETIKNLEKIVYDFNDVTSEEKKCIKFQFVKVWQVTEDLSKLLNPIVEVFKNKSFIVLNQMALNINDSICYADRRYNACINYNGDVFKCTAIDFNSNNKEGVLSSNGEILWNKKKLEKRMNSKFNNTSCKKCRVYPMCGGVCSQAVINSIGKKDSCYFNFDQKKIDQLIIDYLISTI